MGEVKTIGGGGESPQLLPDQSDLNTADTSKEDLPSGPEVTITFGADRSPSYTPRNNFQVNPVLADPQVSLVMKAKTNGDNPKRPLTPERQVQLARAMVASDYYESQLNEMDGELKKYLGFSTSLTSGIRENLAQARSTGNLESLETIYEQIKTVARLVDYLAYVSQVSEAVYEFQPTDARFRKLAIVYSDKEAKREFPEFASEFFKRLRDNAMADAYLNLSPERRWRLDAALAVINSGELREMLVPGYRSADPYQDIRAWLDARAPVVMKEAGFAEFFSVDVAAEEIDRFNERTNDPLVKARKSQVDLGLQKLAATEDRLAKLDRLASKTDPLSETDIAYLEQSWNEMQKSAAGYIREAGEVSDSHHYDPLQTGDSLSRGFVSFEADAQKGRPFDVAFESSADRTEIDERIQFLMTFQREVVIKAERARVAALVRKDLEQVRSLNEKSKVYEGARLAVTRLGSPYYLSTEKIIETAAAARSAIANAALRQQIALRIQVLEGEQAKPSNFAAPYFIETHLEKYRCMLDDFDDGKVEEVKVAFNRLYHSNETMRLEEDFRMNKYRDFASSVAIIALSGMISLPLGALTRAAGFGERTAALISSVGFVGANNWIEREFTGRDITWDDSLTPRQNLTRNYLEFAKDVAVMYGMFRAIGGTVQGLGKILDTWPKTVPYATARYATLFAGEYAAMTGWETVSQPAAEWDLRALPSVVSPEAMVHRLAFLIGLKIAGAVTHPMSELLNQPLQRYAEQKAKIEAFKRDMTSLRALLRDLGADSSSGIERDPNLGFLTYPQDRAAQVAHRLSEIPGGKNVQSGEHGIIYVRVGALNIPIVPRLDPPGQTPQMADEGWKRSTSTYADEGAQVHRLPKAARPAPRRPGSGRPPPSRPARGASGDIVPTDIRETNDKAPLTDEDVFNREVSGSTTIRKILDDPRNSSWAIEIPVSTITPTRPVVEFVKIDPRLAGGDFRSGDLFLIKESVEFRIIELRDGRRFLISGHDRLAAVIVGVRDGIVPGRFLHRVYAVVTKYGGEIPDQIIAAALTGTRNFSWTDALQGENGVANLLGRLETEGPAGSMDVYEVGGSIVREMPVCHPRGDPFLSAVYVASLRRFPKIGNRHMVEGLLPELNRLSYKTDRDYTSYNPGFHFGTRLLTEDDITAFRRHPEMRMLSVGVGRAYLERFLVEELDLQSNQVVLADQGDAYLPAGYESHVFDMFGRWPDFKGSFDLVVFPQSFEHSKETSRISGVQATSLGEARDLLGIVRQVLPYLRPGGEIRFSQVFTTDSPTPEWNIQYTLVRALESDPMGIDLEIEYSNSLIVVRRRNDPTFGSKPPVSNPASAAPAGGGSANSGGELPRKGRRKRTSRVRPPPSRPARGAAADIRHVTVIDSRPDGYDEVFRVGTTVEKMGGRLTDDALIGALEQGHIEAVVRGEEDFILVIGIDAADMESATGFAGSTLAAGYLKISEPQLTSNGHLRGILLRVTDAKKNIIRERYIENPWEKTADAATSSVNLPLPMDAQSATMAEKERWVYLLDAQTNPAVVRRLIEEAREYVRRHNLLYS